MLFRSPLISVPLLPRPGRIHGLLRRPARIQQLRRIRPRRPVLLQFRMSPPALVVRSDPVFELEQPVLELAPILVAVPPQSISWNGLDMAGSDEGVQPERRADGDRGHGGVKDVDAWKKGFGEIVGVPIEFERLVA